MAILEAELEVAAGELGGLKTTFDDAKTAKDTYDEEEERLKNEKANIDGNADATDDEKAAAQQALDDHKDTKAAIVGAFDEA